MDFMTDRLCDGRAFRTFNVIDIFSRQCLCLRAERAFPSDKVIEVLQELVLKQGRPDSITCDNGTEFTSQKVDAWAYAQGISLDFIAPGKPSQNGFIESFNGSVRKECLARHWFDSLEQAQTVLDAWRKDYNEHRPHSALDNLSPIAYLHDVLGVSPRNLISELPNF